MDDVLENPHNLFTPKELLMLGGTIDAPIDQKDWDIPLAIKLGASIKDVSDRRMEKGTFHSFIFVAALNSPGAKAVGSLEGIDPQTGITLGDPRIGILKKVDDDQERFEENAEWTQKVRAALSEHNDQVVWREPEGQIGAEFKG